MIVCVCHRVSDREIARHAQAGMSFDEIQFELGVATRCGRCEDCARELVAQCHACPTQDSAAPPMTQLATFAPESKIWHSSPHLQAV